MSASAQSTGDPLEILIPQSHPSSSSSSSSTESGLSPSLPPSSPSILSSIRKSQSTSSLLCSHATLGMRITFAPLPSPEPRKRRSASQLKLGVASRSSMVRRRQLASVDPNNGDQEGYRIQEQTRGKARQRYQPSGSERWQDRAFSKAKGESRDSDDPFLAVGRLMKSAWKRVASPQTNLRKSAAPGNRLEECEAPVDGFSEGEAEGRQQYSHVNAPADCVENSDDGNAEIAKVPHLNCRSAAAVDL